MKAFLAIAASLIFFSVLISCNKDKFQTKPRLELKDNKPIEVLPGGILTIRMDYYDKDGDVGQGKIIAEKIHLNSFPPPIHLDDSIGRSLPDFPDRDKGEITFQTTYDRLDEISIMNDTIKYMFTVTDRAGNLSDTVYTDIIVARQP